MSKSTVSLKVAGAVYRVTSNAPENELRRLAAVVDQKIGQLIPAGKPVTPQVILLAALALAHDVETERARNDQLKGKTKEAFGKILERVELALQVDEPESKDAT